MNFFFNATGQLIIPPDEDIYQGSVNAAKIYFVAPVSLANTVSVGFTLPNGYVTSRITMSPVSGTGIPGMQTIKGVTFNMWTITLGQDITAYAGNVNVQFFIANGSQTLSTFTANFTVQGGTMSALPTTPPTSINNVWQSFLTAYNATAARISNAENTANRAETAATEAKSIANSAANTAEDAEGIANTASVNASQAYNKAIGVEGAVTTANQNAEAAQATATTAAQSAATAQTAATAAKNKAEAAEAAVSRIEALIPTGASSNNQLADKDFVNSSIATNTANFIGTYPSIEDMLKDAATKIITNNDYALVETKNGDIVEKYDRYKYNASATNTAPNAGELTGTHWFFEFTLNNSSFTAAQWAAINSGITALNKVVQSDLSVTPTSGKAAKFNSSGNLETGTATQSGEAVNLGQLNNAIANVAASVVSVSGTSFTSAMAKNRVYSASTLTSIAPTSSGFTGITADYVAELHFTAGASLTVTLPSNAEYAVGEPIYETGKQYILYFIAKPDLTGVWVFWATNGTPTTIEYATKQELNSAISLVTRQIPTVSKTGTTAPTSSTVADFVGQFYLDTVTQKTYQCTAISSGVYTWTEVGGSGGGGALYRHDVTITGDNDTFTATAHYYSTDDTPCTMQDILNSSKFEMFDYISVKNSGYLGGDAYGIGKTFWYNDMGAGDFEYGFREGIFGGQSTFTNLFYNIATYYGEAEDFFTVDDAIYEV